MLLKLILVFAVLFIGAVYAVQTSDEQKVGTKSSNSNLVDSSYKLSSDLVNLSSRLLESLKNSQEASSEKIGELIRNMREKIEKINNFSDKLELLKINDKEIKNLKTVQKNLINVKNDLSKNRQNLNSKDLIELFNVLDDTIEKNGIDIDISNNLNLNYLIAKVNRVSIKYRYKYMNAVKEIISKNKESEREQKLEKIVAKIKESKKKIQQKEEKSYMDSVDIKKDDKFNSDTKAPFGDTTGTEGNSKGMGGGRF